MRRRSALAALGVSLLACKRREKVRVEPVDETPPEFSSTIYTADPSSSHQLIRGFHPVEQNAWRWTEGKFVVAFAVSPEMAQSGGRVVVNFSVPEPVISRLGPLTLTASVGGRILSSTTYETASETAFEAHVPREMLQDNALSVQFTLDKFLAAGTVDRRELGLVVSTLALSPH